MLGRGFSVDQEGSSVRKALTPVVAAVLLAIAALANAGDPGSEDATPPAVAPAVPSCADPPGPGEAPPETVEFWRAYCAGEIEPAGSNEPTSFISDAPIPQNILDNCERDARENGETSSTCQIAQAIANGDIPPGEYTDQEMNEMLESSEPSE